MTEAATAHEARRWGSGARFTLLNGFVIEPVVAGAADSSVGCSFRSGDTASTAEKEEEEEEEESYR